MTFKKIMFINNLLEIEINKKLSTFNLSIGQWEIIKIIYNSKTNQISAQDLSRKLSIDKRTISLNLKKLENNNYVIRESGFKDKRSKFVSLTDYALELSQDLLDIEKETDILTMNSLSNIDKFNDELDNIINYFDKSK